MGELRDRTRAAWEGEAPDWIEALAAACEAESQTAVARRIRYAASTISQVLSRTYKGNWQAVETAVRGGLMGVTVGCPVLGEISTVDCTAHQRRRFEAITNSVQRRLYGACRTCPNRRTT